MKHITFAIILLSLSNHAFADNEEVQEQIYQFALKACIEKTKNLSSFIKQDSLKKCMDMRGLDLKEEEED